MTVQYKTIEFHRFGSPEGLLKPENRYIRTSGWDTVATEVSPSIGHRDFLLSLRALRYLGAASEGDVLAAQTRLSAEAVSFLPVSIPVPGELLQLDLVTNAAELWAFPFEACFARYPDWLASRDDGVVVTRRIRGDFSETTTAWPTTPRVLFAHAPVTADLKQALVDQHVRALTRALDPWGKGKEIGSELLTVKEIGSAGDLSRLHREFKPTFIHLLAHGTVVRGELGLPEDDTWGLRLGKEGARGTAPADIAEVLSPIDGLPLVVTVAACDSGHESSVLAKQSVVQELHRKGVPVVIGSQLPLTQAGSTVLASTFYHRLLQGDDVRSALHAARVDLKADPAAGHDWLSLVGYVRLPPEGYAEHLHEVGLRMELRLLEAAQDRADLLAAEGQPALRREEFKEVEQLMRQRLASLHGRRRYLDKRQDLLDECCGLEASANKRLAELLFVRGRDASTGDTGERAALMASRDAYRTAYYASLRSHWLGAQQLALDVVLTGTVSNPMDWLVVVRAAEVERDRSEDSYWPFGTLVEMALIAPRAGQPRDLDGALAAASLLVERARTAGKEFAIASTRRQIARYAHWWTAENGYFHGTSDLSADAGLILQRLDDVSRTRQPGTGHQPVPRPPA